MTNKTDQELLDIVQGLPDVAAILQELQKPERAHDSNDFLNKIAETHSLVKRIENLGTLEKKIEFRDAALELFKRGHTQDVGGLFCYRLTEIIELTNIANDKDDELNCNLVCMRPYCIEVAQWILSLKLHCINEWLPNEGKDLMLALVRIKDDPTDENAFKPIKDAVKVVASTWHAHSNTDEAQRATPKTPEGQLDMQKTPKLEADINDPESIQARIVFIIAGCPKPIFEIRDYVPANVKRLVAEFVEILLKRGFIKKEQKTRVGKRANGETHEYEVYSVTPEGDKWATVKRKELEASGRQRIEFAQGDPDTFFWEFGVDPRLITASNPPVEAPKAQAVRNPAAKPEDAAPSKPAPPAEAPNILPKTRRKRRRAKKNDAKHWYARAKSYLKQTKGEISDSEIARICEIQPSIVHRDKVFQALRKSYVVKEPDKQNLRNSDPSFSHREDD